MEVVEGSSEEWGGSAVEVFGLKVSSFVRKKLRLEEVTRLGGAFKFGEGGGAVA